MSQIYKVYVDGQEGTTGLRIHDYLAARPDIELLRIDDSKRKDAAERARLLNSADVAFLCLPDAAAKEAVALTTNPQTCIIDASTAHRTQADWVYGLPELVSTQRSAIQGSKRIANPGCHATAFILLMRPLIDAGLIAPHEAVSATSITGYSGGGKGMIAQYEAHQGDLAAPRPYGLGLNHKHLPEMKAHTGLNFAPVFMPIVADFYKGLAVTVPLTLHSLSSRPSAAQLHQALHDRYSHEAFLRVMPLSDPESLQSGFFDVQGCNDTNRVDIFVFAHESQALLMARLDNLGKGASGAAVQCMNIHLGCAEDAGLSSEVNHKVV